jgi:hypothetical protein
MSVPSKIHTTPLMKIQPEERLSTTELNLLLNTLPKSRKVLAFAKGKDK